MAESPSYIETLEAMAKAIEEDFMEDGPDMTLPELLAVSKTFAQIAIAIAQQIQANNATKH